jgi:hypothetical protein
MQQEPLKRRDPRNKKSEVQPFDTLLRTIILSCAVAVALVLYLSLALYVFPQSYQSIQPKRPEPVIMNVSLSTSEIDVGNVFTISVIGMNKGEAADMQIVSIGFPNLTKTGNIEVLAHDFAQKPILINAGDQVGSDYSGSGRFTSAQYPSVEAFSRPWIRDHEYMIDLQVRPETEGTFTIFVKSVAFPHSWNEAHWPQEGVVDYQKEFVNVYSVHVATKP